ncbi:RIP metalloprotease RseP [Candidatus Falkowbacteria bacterium CG10_big_fil_rev_8_21_14_0_10_39_9]|uniref:Zinc metalloprotease n=1 Tax=Candidatus Falkowbacteria bacterium CG10_big_fil_rev_8_21_14_0_10_39_9 TaxID=1974566 RepID=A0A2M6WQL3_9BACT|nr:MAG: RIP metalloprotease RseP [Candidatus Falkowbacteria bacterium CG10_big_fil_rev_8_21_14_0_10_39_9]
MIFTIIIFLLVLSLLVFAHELGHFWTAKKFGVGAPEFGFGFPPRIFGLQLIRDNHLQPISQTENLAVDVETATDGVVLEKITVTTKEVDVVVPTKRWRFIRGNREITEEDEKYGTVYSLNWIPLGGFVKIKGQDGENQNDRNSFSARPIYQRFLILVAGVLMNIILAMALLSFGFMIGLPQNTDNVRPGGTLEAKKVQIMEVMPGSPAEKAGFQVGDQIVSINDQTVSSESDVQNALGSKAGVEMAINIKRYSENQSIKVTPQILAETNRGGIGVALTASAIVHYPWYQALWEGSKTAILLFWAIIVAFYELIRGLIVGHSVAGAIAGPVGIATLTGQVARMGLAYLLQFTALLSLNLAVINFLPIPALDGGRALFLLFEKIKGRPVKKELENALHNIFFVLLILLIVWVTIKDVLKFF